MKRDSKGYTGENIPLFLAMIVQGPVVQVEGSTHPVESHHIPTSDPSTSQPPISPTSRRTNRQEYVVPQSRSPTQSPVADETAFIGVDVRYGGATTTVTGFEAGQGSGNIDKTLTMPHDSPLPRVNTLGSDEGNMTLQELMVSVQHFKSSQARRRARIVVSDAEDDLEDPSKYGRKIDEIDQDTSISLPVSTTGAPVTTASVVVNTAGPTRVFIANDITMAETLVYIKNSAAKDKGKGKMDESKPVQTKTKLQQEQERLGYEAAVRLQAELEEEERQRIARIHEAASSFNSLSIRERGKHFCSNESEVDRVVPKLAAGSSKRDTKELDQESSKRQKTGESSELAKEPRVKEADELSQEELQQMMIIVLEQGMNVKALQTKVGNHTEVHHFFDDMLKAFNMDDLVMMWSLVKEKFNSTEPTYDKEREIWVELKRLFKPDTDDELWKLQKHIHDLTWKIYDSCEVHHVSIEKGIDIYMLVEKEYLLSRGTLTLMLVAKLLVKQDNEMSRELLRKIFMQTERPRR
ncbi:hypothetical protein Tco_0907141 [Tanacetum coccineum]|uniref:Uncharacterized protein n=1 Tax=Tanacetum coccineum TaxID=301880 RepID=A0ABQ5CLX2_9ASTR